MAFEYNETIIIYAFDGSTRKFWKIFSDKNAKIMLQNIEWDYSVGQTTGLPTYLAWTCVLIYVLAAIAFALGSNKQKGSRAATAELEIEDRPIHIGRW